MYCRNCGNTAEDGSLFCNRCGTRLDNVYNQTNSEDRPSFGFAVLGFFLPLVGFILFLLYESKKPKRAKSVGKGALIGFLTRGVLYIISVIICVFVTAGLVSDMASGSNPLFGDVFVEESTDSILANYADVSFGEFKVTNNTYSFDTSLEVIVTNKATTQSTYCITIEAVDKNGTRLDTDTVYADRLNAGQKINLSAFEYVDEEQIEQLKSATFKVLEIDKLDY